MDLRLEELPLARRQRELRLRNDLPGALANAHIRQGKFSRISPIAIIGRIGVVGGEPREVVQHGFDLFFADPSDEVLKALTFQPFPYIPIGNPHHDLRYPPGRDGADRQPVSPGVVLPLTAEHHLEVRHGITVDIPADAVKSDIGNVVLAARIEAAAHLNPQIFYRRVELKALLAQAGAKLSRQARGGGGSPFSLIRSP